MNHPAENPIDAATLAVLAEHAEAADAESAWPTASWGALQAAGVTAWSVPPECGGVGLSPEEALTGYERLAGACLTTAFLLSQREAAVRRIRDHGSEAIRRRFLPRLARGEIFTTVGLSQLTTSRQHGAPALSVRPDGDGFILDGAMPWVTGADHADVLVTGGTLADGRQMLFLLSRDRDGVAVESPMDLCALRGSRTTQVHCRGVRVGPDAVLAGPAEKVLGGGGKGAGGLETSCLALGLAGAAIDRITAESATRPELREVAERFEQARRGVRRTLHQLAEGGAPPAATALRVRATRLALQATQAALTTSKGTGFVRPHAAQRWARQALFFLVWSCPRPAAEGILGHLLPDPADGE
jgi:alkylation response protein AidB-like acyl-CoA dehydrogenase